MAQTVHAATYRFALEILTPAGTPIDQVALERPDFDRAIEATCFAALRQDRCAEYTFEPQKARVLPRFRGASPRSAGFEISLDLPSGEVRQTFGLDYFRTTARRHGARLALAGRLPAETIVTYHLSALAEEEPPRPRTGWTLDLDTDETTISVPKGSLKSLGRTEKWDSPAADDLRVLVPRHVIDESIAEAGQRPDREVGGALLGHLRRDGDSGELYLEVTCLVPCEETQATAVSVTFTHETWRRVREVLDLRGEGELIVGWVHSHPFRLCAECPLPVPAECQAKVLFYSTDDEFLMELTFPRPFMIGLLVGVEPRLEAALGHAPVKLYGWRGGVIEARGFDVID